MMLATVPCAVCSGTRFSLVYAATIDDHGGEPSAYFGSSRARAGYLPIVRCSRCGLVMTNPQDDHGTLARVYGAHEDNVYELEHDNRRHAALDHLALVTAYRPNPARILDVGCATGIFVGVAQQAGWQATGVDASEWMVSRARIRCPTAAFRVGTLDEIQFPADSFEVITLWDVLEHVSSPRQTLDRVRNWLTPDGCLFLSVPNADSVMARLMGRRWVLLLREHLWYFSPVTLATLLRQAGFDPVRPRPKRVHFSLANVLARLAQYPGPWRGAMSRLSRAPALKRVKLRFPMGEMDVVARVRPGGPATVARTR